jgi:hypothetical protein
MEGKMMPFLVWDVATKEEQVWLAAQVLPY